jgi:biopolymer transport protein ExbD
MKIYLEPDDLDVRIELIPLIDVIFCILVFFILGAVTFGRAQAIGVSLPTAESAQTDFDQALNVVIDNFGQISIAENGQNIPVSEDQLTKLLSAYVRQYPQGVVQLQADHVISYGQVIRIFDLLREVGGSRVALAVDQKKNPSQTPGAIPTAPGALQPNLTQPNLRQPNLAQPNPAQPNLNQPNSTQPNLNQPNSTQPNLPQPTAPVGQPSGLAPQLGSPEGSLPPQEPADLPTSGSSAPTPSKPRN